MRDRIQFRNQSHTKIVASFVSLLGREGSYDAESQPRALVPVLLAIRRKWGVGAEDKLVREGLMEAYSETASFAFRATWQHSALWYPNLLANSYEDGSDN